MLRRIRKSRWAYYFLIPKLILFFTFIALPVLWALIIAFQEFRVFDTVWVGLANFRRVFTSDLFRIALWNTLKYTVVVVPTQIIIALVLASLIHPLGNKTQSFFRAAFYLPTVTSVLVITMVWRWMYNYRFGLFNYFVQTFLGLDKINWLNSSQYALWSIILMSVLTPPGVGVILYLAAMGAIPDSLYEAAKIDGAGPLKTWTSITIPLLKPTTLYLLILQTIGSFQVFVQVLMLTGGGPGHATTTLVTIIYDTAFRDGQFGLAAAQALVLFGMVLLISLFQYKFLRGDVEY